MTEMVDNAKGKSEMQCFNHFEEKRAKKGGGIDGLIADVANRKFSGLDFRVIIGALQSSLDDRRSLRFCQKTPLCRLIWISKSNG